MAILNKQFQEYFKLRLIVLALICERGVVKNEKLVELMKISSSSLRTHYTEPLQKEGLIQCVKIHSKKAWGAKPIGHALYKDINILLNPPTYYLENLDLGMRPDDIFNNDDITKASLLKLMGFENENIGTKKLKNILNKI